MKDIVIKVTDFQHALMAHRSVDVVEAATKKIVGEIDRYGQDLGNRLMQNLLNDPDNITPIIPDRETLVQGMFDENDYMTAADVEEAQAAAKDAAEHPIPNFKERTV